MRFPSRRIAAYVLLGLFAYLAWLALLYPFQEWIERAVEQQVPVPLVLHGTRVRPWAISGDSLTLTLPDQRTLTVGPWNLRPDWGGLMNGQRRAGLSAGLLGGQVTGEIGGTDAAMDLDLALRDASAAQLGHLFPEIRLFDPQGRMQGDIRLHSMNSGPMQQAVRQGRFHIEVQDAGAQLPLPPTFVKLGQVRAQGELNANELAADLSAAQGDVTMSARLTVQLAADAAESRVFGRGSLQASPDAPQPVRLWVKLLGETEGKQGTVRFRLEGTLAAPRLVVVNGPG